MDVFDAVAPTSLTEVGISQGTELFVVVDVEAEGIFAAEAAIGWAVVATPAIPVAGFKLLTPEFSFSVSDTRELADEAETPLASVL